MINKSIVNKLVTIILFFVFSFGLSQSAFANIDTAQGNIGKKETVEQKEGFAVGKIIIEHISDGYEWPILSIGKHHITVPLPVILYDQGKWMIFSSSVFHHNHGVYKGYYISDTGMNTGKIVRKDAAGKAVRPTLDISITRTVAAVMLNAFMVILIFLAVAKSYRRREGMAPKGLQSAVEPLILLVRDEIALSSIGEKNYLKYTPYLLSLFFFIFLSNLVGIFPFFPLGISVTGNIAVTGVMAAFTFAITTYKGNKHYWKDIFNTPGVPWWLKFPFPLMPIVEVMGIFTKPIVLMIRLFANMIAGHLVILGFIALIFIFGKMSIGLGYGVSIVSVGFSIFLDLLEVLIALIQAYVFVILSALYFGLATEEPEH